MIHDTSFVCLFVTLSYIYLPFYARDIAFVGWLPWLEFKKTENSATI